MASKTTCHNKEHVTFTTACHFHVHMSFSRLHATFTKDNMFHQATTWHYTTLRYITLHHLASTHNITRVHATLRDITLHYVASLGVDTQHYTIHATLRDITLHYVTLRCITWRRHTNIASSMLVFDCKAPLLGDHLFTQREAKAILSSSSRPTDQLAVIFSTGVPLLITFA